MRLLRIKITDAAGFRGLPCGFEHYFRPEQFKHFGKTDSVENTQGEVTGLNEEFEPFVCAGPNGSGKSNLLEALAAIFYQLEIQRVRRSFLPEVLANLDDLGAPYAFELDYTIAIKPELLPSQAQVREAWVQVRKEVGASPKMIWHNAADFPELSAHLAQDGIAGEHERDFLLPEYVLGYSSGENEILSLPFFKLRFVQFDEYWNALVQQQSYPGRPEARLAYLDDSFSQAILLCNLLFQDEETLQPFREDVEIETLKEFRIIIKRSTTLSDEDAYKEFGKNNPVVSIYEDEVFLAFINLMHWLEADAKSADNFDPIVTRLKRCATLCYEDQKNDTLILDYWVNDATKEAFRKNFDDALTLFQAFQVLLTLNLYTVSDELKEDLYCSNSHYVSETVPVLASDERIMRFKNFFFTKRGVNKPMLLKELSDGEHQLLHSLGLCLLFRETNSLFLLDEPETHFNPSWRANFISRLRQCFPKGGNADQEMLITTHTPFLISDSWPERVFVFSKDERTGNVLISTPEYNTLGASINKITAETFEKRETIGAHANDILQSLLNERETTDDIESLIDRVMHTIGDSIERTLAVKALLDFEKEHQKRNKQRRSTSRRES